MVLFLVLRKIPARCYLPLAKLSSPKSSATSLGNETFLRLHSGKCISPKNMLVLRERYGRLEVQMLNRSWSARREPTYVGTSTEQRMPWSNFPSQRS